MREIKIEDLNDIDTDTLITRSHIKSMLTFENIDDDEICIDMSNIEFISRAATDELRAIQSEYNNDETKLDIYFKASNDNFVREMMNAVWGYEDNEFF